MRQELASNSLHDREAPQLVRKKTLEASPNTLLFGNAMLHEPSFIDELDQAPKNATLVSIRVYVDDFM